jgi:hypothetical protein
MIDRQFGFLMILCDECRDHYPKVGQHEVGCDFRELLTDMEEDGWANIRIALNEFEHRCPECCKQMEEDNSQFGVGA